METKKCNHCKRVLKINNFAISADFYSDRKISSRCKECLNAIAMYSKRYKPPVKKLLFTIDEASEICEAYATGLFTQMELVKQLGVSHSTINNLVNNKIKSYFKRKKQ